MITSHLFSTGVDGMKVVLNSRQQWFPYNYFAPWNKSRSRRSFLEKLLDTFIKMEGHFTTKKSLISDATTFWRH
jgi:hypothetical protein